MEFGHLCVERRHNPAATSVEPLHKVVAAHLARALVATRGYLYYSEVEPQLHESGSIWCTLTLTILGGLGLTVQGDLPGLIIGAWLGAMMSFRWRFRMTHFAALIESLVYIISLGVGSFLVSPFFQILMARPRY